MAGSLLGFTRRHGWITLLGVLVVVGAVLVALGPWAYHIGGQFTPFGRWTGVGAGTSPSGQRYALQVNIAAELGHRACSQFGCDDYEGTVVVCTAAGMYTFDNMTGTIDGWGSTDGHHMVIDARSHKAGPARYLTMYLRGTWSGSTLNLTDGGYLTRDFLPGGQPATQFGSPRPADTTTFAVKPGDFGPLCASVRR